ncbi:MAG TPA: tetratricopeptide repeat protein [Bacteroidia bacterium]|nr:tetratricopeptide repeat protein [Bacteroidia bacterium]
MNAKSKRHTKSQQVSIKKESQLSPVTTNWLLVISIALITFLCYRYSLQNEFTHWDDNLYVEDNNYIKDLTPHNLKMILFHNITNAYYHPITILSLACNYHFSKMNPYSYYATNVVIHLLNTCIMFFLMLLVLETLTEKGYGEIRGKPWLAALGALLFGIHPMHVESVSWLADRKDVLYCFFYFLGLMAYIKYSKEEKVKGFALVFLCYLCSLLSKPLAVVFPFSLFVLDVLLKRDKSNLEIIPILKPFYIVSRPFINILKTPLSKRAISVDNVAKLTAEKIPFFLISLCAGIWAFHDQKLSGAMNATHALNVLQRFMYAGYSFMIYAVKAFIPFDLSAYYPYPNPAVPIPIIYYAAPFISFLIVLIPIYMAYKAGGKYLRMVLFGIGFFFFNVMFVLQFVASGPAILAERYSYIAYFGLFTMVIYFISEIIEKRQSLKMPLQAGLVGFICLLTFITYGRVKTWHNTETLWRDVVNHSPYPIPAEYENLGIYYANKGMIDSAFNNFKIAVDLHTPDASAYTNVANIYGMRKEYEKSIEAFNAALRIDSSDIDTYINQAITYSAMGRIDMALKDDEHAARISPDSPKLFENRAVNYLNDKQYDNAIADYNKLVQIDPNKALNYLNRGIAQFNKGNIKTALEDFNHAIIIDPANAGCLYDMSLAYQQVNDYSNALNCALKAKQNGYPVTDLYISTLQKGKN